MRVAERRARLLAIVCLRHAMPMSVDVARAVLRNLRREPLTGSDTQLQRAHAVKHLACLA